MDFAGPVLITAVAVAALIVLVIIGFIYAKVRFKIASPDEALIITGRKSGKPVINPETGQETTDLSGQRVVIGGGTPVKPVFEQVARLSLASQSFPVTAEDATTKSRNGGKPVSSPESGQATTDLSGQRVVIGGGSLVKPVFEQVARLSLASESFPVTAEDATTESGIGVTLRSIAVVKVGGTERM